METAGFPEVLPVLESTALPVPAEVEVVLEPKPEVEPMVEPLFPVDEELVLTMPAAREFKLARLVFPSRFATAAPNEVAAN